MDDKNNQYKHLTQTATILFHALQICLEGTEPLFLKKFSNVESETLYVILLLMTVYTVQYPNIYALIVLLTSDVLSVAKPIVVLYALTISLILVVIQQSLLSFVMVQYGL